MLKKFRFRGNQHGVTVVLVAILMVVFLGLAALAVDISHLYLVRNELQNGADAGALAGARFLYREDSTAPYGIVLDTGEARVKALDTATANKSENLAVEVDDPTLTDGDIQVGHWSFGIGALAKGFYLPDGPPIYDIWNYSTQDLDANINFINAVKVTTRRGGSGSSPAGSHQAASFFARIFNIPGFSVLAEGVAYIGYEGAIGPGDVDAPIAICRDAITDPNSPPGEQKLLCGVGRMINSAAGVGEQTGGWTNFTQDPPQGDGCKTANPPSVLPYVKNKCSGSVNPTYIYFGYPLGTQNGMDQNIYDELISCWQTRVGLPDNPTSKDYRDFPTQPMTLTLPVIKCPGSSVLPCREDQPVDGAVQLEIVWITRTGFKDGRTGLPKEPVPRQMGDWTCQPVSSNPDPENVQCWKQFVQAFGLKDVLNNADATAEDKTIYFRPQCKELDLGGKTGGHNYGVLAKVPVLVK